jgi:hypothetical protein
LRGFGRIKLAAAAVVALAVLLPVNIEAQPGDNGVGPMSLRPKDVSGAGSTPDK